MSPSLTPRSACDAAHSERDSPFAKNVRSAVSVSATSMPRSPSTRVRRTFVGDSQSTTQLKATPLRAARPVTRTRSSCSRPMRCWVCAATRSTGDAAEPADEVEVVRGEVLDDADVADAIGERARRARWR